MNYRQIRSITISLILAMAGIFTVYAAELKDGVTHISQSEFRHKAAQTDSVVIDIRTDEEFKAGHIMGAKHIPLASILENISLLDEYKGRDMVFYCHSGGRVSRLTDYLQEIDHPNQDRLFHLQGDMSAWARNGLPVQKP